MNEIRCMYCGGTDGPFHMDHVVPQSRGGPDTPKNLVRACSECNLSKSDKLPSEWLAIVPELVARIERDVSATVAAARKPPVKRRLTVYLPEPLAKRFAVYCAENYLELSDTISVAVETFLEEKKGILP